MLKNFNLGLFLNFTVFFIFLNKTLYLVWFPWNCLCLSLLRDHKLEVIVSGWFWKDEGMCVLDSIVMLAPSTHRHSLPYAQTMMYSLLLLIWFLKIRFKDKMSQSCEYPVTAYLVCKKRQLLSTPFIEERKYVALRIEGRFRWWNQWKLSFESRPRTQDDPWSPW